jgi:ATP-dependent protease Clp ATPase subunit
VALTTEDRCSFCGKRGDQVKQLIAGQKIAEQHVFICNECVLIATPVIEYSSPKDPTSSWPPPKIPKR